MFENPGPHQICPMLHLDEKAYISLSAVPARINLADVFRAPEHGGPIVGACLRLSLKRLWLQDDIVNVEAAQRARAGGMTVVMDCYLWRNYILLCRE